MSSYSTDPISLFTDYTSALPIAFIFTNMIEATNVGNYTEMGLLIFTMLIADGLTFGIKKLSKNAPQKWNFLLNRPIGACNTDLLSRNGPKSVNTPGFPSGHMTMASVFSVYRLLRLYRKQGSIMLVFKNNTMEALLYVAIIIAMAYARWYKRCHNIVQIIAGFILGSVFAFVLDKIVRDFL
tara:strand:- start:527 stop:1072 length:546 start_codon:yes stop_codon:yes gene_type:complete